MRNFLLYQSLRRRNKNCNKVYSFNGCTSNDSNGVEKGAETYLGPNNSISFHFMSQRQNRESFCKYSKTTQTKQNYRDQQRKSCSRGNANQTSKNLFSREEMMWGPKTRTEGSKVSKRDNFWKKFLFLIGLCLWKGIITIFGIKEECKADSNSGVKNEIWTEKDFSKYSRCRLLVSFCFCVTAMFYILYYVYLV